MMCVFKRSVWRAAAGSAALLLTAGCSLFSDSDPRNDPAPLTDYVPSISAHALWTVSVGRGGDVGFAPVVANGAAYAATPDGSVVKIDLETGQTVWRATLPERLSAGVGADGKTVAVVTHDATIIALDDMSGTEQWRARASSEISIPPLVGDGVVVVRSGDYRIQAFSQESGELRWRLQRPGPALALRTNMQLLLLEGLVISGLPNGKLLAVDSQSGDTRWEGTVALSQGATDLERMIDVVGLPQVQGNLLCGVAYQGQISCFDINRGGVMHWQQTFSSKTGLSSDAEQVYAANTRDVVQSYSLRDGTLLWTQDALRNRSLSAPATVAGAVAFGDLQGYVHFLSRAEGHLLGRLSTGSSAVVSPPVAVDDKLLVQTLGGQLWLIQAR